MKKLLCWGFSLFVACLSANANKELLKPEFALDKNGFYRAAFVSANDTDLQNAVVRFRKKFALDSVPEKLRINITADCKYRLYVNGRFVGRGSDTGDFKRYYFDTINIAPYLKKGENIIAAAAWSMGEFKPVAFTSQKVSLWVQADNPEYAFLDTINGQWKAAKDKSTVFAKGMFYGGGAEIVHADKALKNFAKADYDDSSWGKAVAVFRPRNSRVYGQIKLMLAPREIPPAAETPFRAQCVRKIEALRGGKIEPADFIRGEALQIPANAECRIVVDAGVLTNAYMSLATRGGKGAEIALSYCESFGESDGKTKGNRNEIDGKVPFTPIVDRYYPDGGKFVFESNNFRSFRYVQFDIKTSSEPLVLEDFRGMSTGYPFFESAEFDSSDKSLADIWRTAWRTARLCAVDSYFDCPFYERLQYIGDTRIQALISLYVSGDSRLMKKAIKMFGYSRQDEGITQSRYPSTLTQFIPPFSLFWINMVADYDLHCSDAEFVRENLDGIESVVNYFVGKMDSRTGMLGANLPYWYFLDWVKDWPLGVPPESEKSGSAAISLHLANALDDAARLMRAHGREYNAPRYEALSKTIKEAVYRHCWKASRGLLADAAGLEKFSQHTNIMGILTDAIPAEKQARVFEKILSEARNSYSEHAPDDVLEATFYYKFYLFAAAEKVGRGGDFLNMLKPWRDMLKLGLTTFAESPEPSRSDCHAWSASPIYEFLSLVAGVKPTSAGFKTVRIAPHLGGLEFVRAAVPVGSGGNLIRVHFRRVATGGLSAEIDLPKGVSGEFVWRGQTRRLVSGKQNFEIK